MRLLKKMRSEMVKEAKTITEEKIESMKEKIENKIKNELMVPLPRKEVERRIEARIPIRPSINKRIENLLGLIMEREKQREENNNNEELESPDNGVIPIPPGENIGDLIGNPINTPPDVVLTPGEVPTGSTSGSIRQDVSDIISGGSSNKRSGSRKDYPTGWE